MMFDSWDGRNDYTSTIEQAKLEQHFGPSAVAFSSYQTAISAILEVLGTRTQRIPVVLAVTASPDTLAATLRAGGDPILLDIRPQTLQIDPDQLRTVLDELKAAVVILARPAGQPVDPALLAMTEDMPTILDSRLPPHEDIEADCVCTFNVFDLALLAGSGALIIHRFEQQVRELKMVRSGLLGLSANLNEALATTALKRLASDPKLANRKAEQIRVVRRYSNLFAGKLAYPFDQSPEWPYFIVAVDSADRAIAHLHSHDITAAKPVYPLHLLSDINKRWVEKPSYPVAEELSKKLIALPTHSGILDKEGIVVLHLEEVAHDNT